MHVSCRLIIVAIIYSCYNILAIKSNTCDCDILEVNESNGPIGYQNFTMQSGTLYDKPFYISMKQHVIYWNNVDHWCYAYDFHSSQGAVGTTRVISHYMAIPHQTYITISNKYKHKYYESMGY